GGRRHSGGPSRGDDRIATAPAAGNHAHLTVRLAPGGPRRRGDAHRTRDARSATAPAPGNHAHLTVRLAPGGRRRRGAAHRTRIERRVHVHDDIDPKRPSTRGDEMAGKRGAGASAEKRKTSRAARVRATTTRQT